MVVFLISLIVSNHKLHKLPSTLIIVEEDSDRGTAVSEALVHSECPYKESQAYSSLPEMSYIETNHRTTIQRRESFVTDDDTKATGEFLNTENT